jgi:ABC-2 type transport system permease protein
MIYKDALAPMTAYLAILSARFRMLLQYRAAAFAGFITQLFWGLIRVMIFAAFYRSSNAPQPMTYEEVETYIWLGQAMLVMMPWNLDPEIKQMMRTGGVAYELLRPLDLYLFWFSRALALRTAPASLRGIPLFAIAWLFFGLQLPPTWTAAWAWIFATLLAVLLSSAISTLQSISVLWTISGEGMAQLSFATVVIFSGMIIPLPLFPDWMQPFITLLPFRGLCDVPFRIYAGHISPAEYWRELMQQLAWIVGLIFLGRWILSRGMRRLVVQGG